MATTAGLRRLTSSTKEPVAAGAAGAAEPSAEGTPGAATPTRAASGAAGLGLQAPAASSSATTRLSLLRIDVFDAQVVEQRREELALSLVEVAARLVLHERQQVDGLLGQRQVAPRLPVVVRGLAQVHERRRPQRQNEGGEIDLGQRLRRVGHRVVSLFLPLGRPNLVLGVRQPLQELLVILARN